MKAAGWILLIPIAVALPAHSAEPERKAGLSVHMLPKEVADISGEKPGFVDSTGGKTLETARALVDYFKKLAVEIQQNGIWVVTTDPDAYEEAELKNLESLIALYKKEKVPLFLCRGSELPNGWKRVDR